MPIAARAMQVGTTLLRPLPVESDNQPACKVVDGIDKGDLPNIGADGFAPDTPGALALAGSFVAE